MIEINWDLAPKGTVGVAQRHCHLAFVDDEGNVFIDGHWGISMGWQTIATRQQTKTVADEQEGEKWTHLHRHEKCIIKHVIGEKAWVECEWMNDQVVKKSKLKPIKPKLTEDAKRQLEFYVQYRVDKYGDYAMKADLADYLSKHDITEVQPND